MKNEQQRDDDAKEYWLSDQAGLNVMRRARAWAKDLGESFVVFVGSLPAENNAVRPFRSQQDAVEFARDEAGYGTPRNLIHVKRIKV